MALSQRSSLQAGGHHISFDRILMVAEGPWPPHQCLLIPCLCCQQVLHGGAAPVEQQSAARVASYPLTAWRSLSEGKAVRTSTVCSKMRRRVQSTRSSPPLAMKAGIHRMLPLRLCSRRRKRSFHSSLARSWKARCTTEGFMVTKLVLHPTSL